MSESSQADDANVVNEAASNEESLEENNGVNKSTTTTTGSHLNSTKESLSSSDSDSPRRRQTTAADSLAEILDITDDSNYHPRKFKGPVEVDASTVNFSTVSSAYTLVHVESANRPLWRRWLPGDDGSGIFSCLTIRNSHVALAVLCLCAMSQNITVGGANNAILSTIERAFFMTSMESALFLSVYDIANTISSPIIGYFGDRKLKPRIIGMSMFGLSLASFIMILPQFIGDYGINSTPILNTNMTNNEMLCNQTSTATSFYVLASTTTSAPKAKVSAGGGGNLKFMFYLANSINGISSVALYTITISYIENIFEKEQVNLRQGIYYTLGGIGVGVGMILTGNFLNVNGDIHRKFPQFHGTLPNLANSRHNPGFGPPPPPLPRNPGANNSSNVNWIGAWWIIYAIAAVVNFVLALFVFRFSASLVKTRPPLTIHPVATTTTLVSKADLDPVPAAAVVVTSGQTSSQSPPPHKSGGFCFYLNDFFLNSKRILSNKVFFFIVCCTTCETLLIKGFSSYLTKYLEYEYRLFASTATMIAGAIGFVSLVGGVLFGSFIIKYFKWQVKECAVFITVILSITSVLFLGLIIHCPQEQYIGSDFATANYTVEGLCGCDTNAFYPVCYKHVYLFQTPCHAGCQRHYQDQDDIYSECLVLNDLIGGGGGADTLSSCDRPNRRCIPNLIIVSIIGLLILFLSSIVILPILRIILGTVSVENQSFALGIRSLITKLFGNIPGPLIFASIVDKSCVQWTKNSYNKSKTCRLYDNLSFSIGLGVLGSSFRVGSALFAFITLMLIRRQSKRAEAIPVPQTTETNGRTNRTYQFDDNNEIVLNPGQIHQHQHQVAREGSNFGLTDFYDINLSDHEEKSHQQQQVDDAQKTSNCHLNGSYRHDDENTVETF